jgi:hypothetical protein
MIVDYRLCLADPGALHVVCESVSYELLCGHFARSDLVYRSVQLLSFDPSLWK